MNCSLHSFLSIATPSIEIFVSCDEISRNVSASNEFKFIKLKKVPSDSRFHKWGDSHNFPIFLRDKDTYFTRLFQFSTEKENNIKT